VRIGRLRVHSGINARVSECGVTDGSKPWLGFCYGFWMPHVKFWRVRIGADYSILHLRWNFLCFHGAMTLDDGK